MEGKDCEAINFYKSWERLVFIDHYQYPVVKKKPVSNVIQVFYLHEGYVVSLWRKSARPQLPINPIVTLKRSRNP